MADLSDHYSYHRSQVCDDDLYGWLLDLIAGPEWHRQAACKGEGGALFFAERSGNDSVQQVAAAKIVCVACPVRAECLEAGMDEQHGVWGGTTPRQRRRLRQSRIIEEGRSRNGTVRPPCGTRGGYKAHKYRNEIPCEPCLEANRMRSRMQRSG